MKIGINPPRLSNPMDVHVVRNAGLWSIRLEKNQFTSGTYYTQFEAIAHGMTQAREAASMLFVQGRDGNVRLVRNFAGWIDPFD